MNSVMGKTVPITDGAWQEAVFAVVGAARDALVRPVMCRSSSSRSPPAGDMCPLPGHS